jgi:ATP-binding cassette, subfamily B, bacterial
MFRASFPYIRQLDSTDCGPSCLRMIARYYGKVYTQEAIANIYQLNREGISLHGLSKVAERLGFQTLLVRVDFDKVKLKAPFPVIAHWNQNHFVVVHKIKGNRVYVADPETGLTQYTKEEFLEGWAQALKNGKQEGILLLMEPTPEFFNRADEPVSINKSNFGFLFKYLMRYKYYIGLIIAGLLLGSVFQLIFPFLTQAVVDKGIGARNIHFIYVILLAQLVFYIANTVVEFIRGWILIHISSRINVYIISDFLMKLMRLPIRYFDSRLTGDLIQRIRDHKRIEQFITDSLLKSLFAVFSLMVCSMILAYFNWQVFLVFLGLTTIEMGWIFFLKKMRVVDNQSFALMAQDQSKLMEMVNGMQEIKLNNIESRKRWEWESLQASLFSVNVKKLKLNQYQDGGSRFFGYIQFVAILFISCMAVLNNQMTLGTLLAIIFIIGELNRPISQLINFIISAQYAKLSLERLNEIHQRPDEEKTGAPGKITELPAGRTIKINNVSFSYQGGEDRKVLENINLVIPEGKVTAIVGVSGSGKTTLLKLLLKFYSPVHGTIKVGGADLENIHSTTWRQHCGTVMQDSYLFSDSIANNIALEEPIDRKRLLEAVEIANIREFIESLPLDYNTKIGQEGLGLSQGQKQRLLIARAVYKNPAFLFFDEATNALDANNEKIIMRNLNQFFKGRTVLIVAHRLSTVKNADQIIVIDEGRIAEYGRHDELVYNKNQYYGLVKNQLELGV